MNFQQRKGMKVYNNQKYRDTDDEAGIMIAVRLAATRRVQPRFVGPTKCLALRRLRRIPKKLYVFRHVEFSIYIFHNF